MQLCFRTQPGNQRETSDRGGVCAETPVEELSNPLGLLNDISSWVPVSKLSDWIRAEIEKLGWTFPLMLDAEAEYAVRRRRRFLSLLSFAYTTGVFNSEEISRKCCSDPHFQALCEGEAPPAIALWNFRRRNRLLLERILAGVFLLAVEERFGLEATLLPPELEQDLCDRAAERLDVARHMDAGD